MVEPIDPGERCHFNSLERLPWRLPVDQLGLVEAVDGFGERVDAPIFVKVLLAVVLTPWAAGKDIRRFRGPDNASGIE